MSLVRADRFTARNGVLASLARHPHTLWSLLIAAGYAAVATIWIALSDRALFLFFVDTDVETLTLAQSIKGWLFVAATATLLFFGARLIFRQSSAKDSALRSQAISEDRLIDALPEPVFELDAGCRIVRLNQASERMLGRTRDQLKGVSGLDLVVEADRAAAAQAFDEARSGAAAELRCHILTKHGTTPFLLRSTPLRGPDGAVQRILGIGHDMSAVERAETQSRSRFRGLQLALIQFVEAIGAMAEARDPYTQGHQERVATLACDIAREAGMDEQRIEGLRLAALVHDLGKIAVPMEFLTKSTPLSESEMAVTRSHPRLSYDVLRRVDFPWPVAMIAYQHHERMDGSGYPEGIKGDAILPEARILGIADVIDAMESDRLYRRAPGLKKALEELRANRGRLYDPEMVDAALRVLSPRIARPNAA
ncbi:MAG: HD domain-containing phosphohydrolase [Alphaproteobacteria bacterium]